MLIRRLPIPAALRLLAGVVLVAQGGCMSALTTASLRDVLLDTVDSLTEATAGPAAHSARDADVEATLATDDPADESSPVVSEPPKTLSLDEAVERAVDHLQGGGELDAATQAALLSILENTRPEDWPAAIDAFTASLSASLPPRRTASSTQPPVVEPQPVPTPALAPVVPTAPAEPATIAFVAAARPVVPVADADGDALLAIAVVDPLGAEEPTSDEPSETGEEPPQVVDSPAASLSVHNACFVSRVRAWGVVDRFPDAAFRPGQDVIVYFELDAPTNRQSPAGHATSIDTLFRLVAPDGRQIGQWDFEPIDETCHSPRRDYFARYFLRIPETAPPGPCRLEFVVTDLVAGTSTQAHLDLDVRQ